LNEFLSPYKQLKGHRSKNKKKGMLSNGVWKSSAANGYVQQF
jgi:hypothetical protein